MMCILCMDVIGLEKAEETATRVRVVLYHDVVGVPVVSPASLAISLDWDIASLCPLPHQCEYCLASSSLS